MAPTRNNALSAALIEPIVLGTMMKSARCSLEVFTRKDIDKLQRSRHSVQLGGELYLTGEIFVPTTEIFVFLGNQVRLFSYVKLIFKH